MAYIKLQPKSKKISTSQGSGKSHMGACPYGNHEMKKAKGGK